VAESKRKNQRNTLVVVLCKYVIRQRVLKPFMLLVIYLNLSGILDLTHLHAKPDIVANAKLIVKPADTMRIFSRIESVLVS